MDRYQRVEKPKPESPINENEIRITTQGVIRNYISYATTLLQEKRVREIVLKAMGQAISKTVAVAEIIKKRIPRLHQDTAIGSLSITDVWEPIEEGLVPVEMTRHVSMISITLSTKELNKNSPGYQAPYNVEPSKAQPNYQQPKQARIPYNAVNEDSYNRGRGRRGRGRGRGRGCNRGGYGNYQGTYGNYQDNGGYSNRGRGSGRGRGWGYRVLDISSDEEQDSDEVVVVGEVDQKARSKSWRWTMKDVDDDCVVLDGDPHNKPVEYSAIEIGFGSDELLIIGEKGQIACRDYPHSRHLCPSFPFSTTPHERHCKQCYCYVCDSHAPCVNWGTGISGTDHCHATDKDETWKIQRRNFKLG